MTKKEAIAKIEALAKEFEEDGYNNGVIVLNTLGASLLIDTDKHYASVSQHFARTMKDHMVRSETEANKTKTGVTIH